MSRKDYVRKYQRLWIRKRREDYIKELGGKCVQCGTTEDLEFHHKEKKNYNINSILSYSKICVKEELKRCELLCNKHHKEIHGRNLVHGTKTGYGYGCRCKECRKANAVYRAEYRRKTGHR